MSDLVQKRLIAKALKRKGELQKQRAFSPDDLNSVPTPEQEQALQDIMNIRQRYVIGGTQTGKSSTGAREAAWIFENTHPYYKEGNKKTHQLVVGGSHKTIREELWLNKLDKYLSGKEGIDYRITRDGNALNGAVHKNGNRISFFSHDNPETCRKQLQGIIADHIWLDEMPGKYSLLIEIIERGKSKKAPIIATFTPHLKLAEIKNHVENGSEPYIKKYVLDAYDNPINKTTEKMAELDHGFSLMSKAKKNTYAHGAWFAGDEAVYDFSEELHCEHPLNYSATWRHVESVDPASAGKAGYALLAEDPTDNIWYLIKECYIEGKAPSELLEAVKNETGNVNLVKRVADSHETWFIKQAALDNIWYSIPHKKTQRKKELIKNLQESLHQGKLKISPWCNMTVDEFMSCQWAESGERIVNAKSFHILDCLQYALDVLPSPESLPIAKTVYQLMESKDKRRRELEAIANRQPKRANARIMPNRRSRWR